VINVDCAATAEQVGEGIVGECAGIANGDATASFARIGLRESGALIEFG